MACLPPLIKNSFYDIPLFKYEKKRFELFKTLCQKRNTTGASYDGFHKRPSNQPSCQVGKNSIFNSKSYSEEVQIKEHIS